MGRAGVDRIHLAQDREKWRARVNEHGGEYFWLIFVFNVSTTRIVFQTVSSENGFERI